MPLITCKICKKQRYEKPGRIKQGRGVFCSKNCFDFFQTGKRHPEKWKGKYRNCLICKKLFYLRPSQIKYKKSLYCSRNCSSKRIIVVSEKTRQKLRKISLKLGLKPPSQKGKKQTIIHKFRRGIYKTGSETSNWKGENVGYAGIHQWLKKNYGKANKCENEKCKYKNKIRFE